jgi:hypothetical protein
MFLRQIVPRSHSGANPPSPILTLPSMPQRVKTADFMGVRPHNPRCDTGDSPENVLDTSSTFQHSFVSCHCQRRQEMLKWPKANWTLWIGHLDQQSLESLRLSVWYRQEACAYHILPLVPCVEDLLQGNVTVMWLSRPLVSSATDAAGKEVDPPERQAGGRISDGRRHSVERERVPARSALAAAGHSVFGSD